jgi:uncharacterized lipoprotein YddW (UPF0748 family)
MKHLPLIALALVLLLAASAGVSPKAEGTFDIRAVWVTRWAYGGSEEVRQLFRQLESLGINTVFFQVRGACDALYQSSYEPWSAVLSGNLGADPGWDPLGIAVEEGHRRGMKVHAWINVFTAWPVSESGDPPARTIPLHVYHAHREWLARNASGALMPMTKAEAKHNYVFLSPTHQGVQDHITKVVQELISRYAVDGLHLDYVRFPDSTYSYDADSRGSFRMDLQARGLNEEDLPFAKWRRQELTEFVGRLAATARETREGVKVSAAVWQEIDAGRGYHLQDGIQWVRLGYVDFLVPMFYTLSLTSFRERLGAYCDSAGPGALVAGLGPYLEAFTDSILEAELQTCRDSGVQGFSIFNSEYALRYSHIIKNYTSD